jgi:hypothetical protein
VVATSSWAAAQLACIVLPAAAACSRSSSTCWPLTDAGLRFEDPVILSTGKHPTSIFLADYNGDGLEDLASIDRGGATSSASIALRLGNKTGFGTSAEVGVTFIPLAGATGDISGDGLADIIVSACLGQSNTLQVLLGDSLDGLRRATTASTSYCSDAMVAASFFGERRIRIAAVDSGISPTRLSTPAIDIYEGDSRGSLSLFKRFPVNAVPVALASADLNGDGIEDLVVSDNDACVTVMIGGHDGVLTSQNPVSLGTHRWFDALTIADVNGDHKLDLALVSNYDGLLAVLLGNGDGTFGAPRLQLIERLATAVRAIDLDGDGRPELAISYAGLVDGLEIFSNNGEGEFTFAGLLQGGSSVADLRTRAAGSHSPSILTADETGNTIHWLKPQCTTMPMTTTPDAGTFATATHPSAVQMPANSGTIIASPALISITYEEDTDATDLASFDKALVTSQWLHAVGDEYGIGAGSYLGSFQWSHAPRAITDDQIAAALTASIGAGLLPAPSGPSSQTVANTVYAVHFPAGTSVFRQGEVSCGAFGAYHWFTESQGVRFAYLVIPTCSDNRDDIQVAISHELIEALTDPDGSGYRFTDLSPWTFIGGEVGDVCLADFFHPPFVQVTEGVVAQRTWSNAAAAAGKDPCVPEPSVPYFSVSATPDLIQLPPGGVASVELKAWSSAAVDAWTLLATAPSLTTPDLKLELSSTSINNGGTATLTITPLRTLTLGFLIRVYSVRSDRDYSFTPIAVIPQ